MKQLIFSLQIMVCLFLFLSCEDFLDRTPDDKLDEKEVYTRYDKVDGLVTDLYSNALRANKPLVYFGHFGSAPATDECGASSHEGAIPHQFNVGNWGPASGIPGSTGQYWGGIYAKIRKANIIFEGIEKYQTPDNPREGRKGDLSKRMGEVFFLRGYLYYLLVRTYGEAPYVDYVVKPNDEMRFEKISVHELVEKICADADSAYNRVDAFNPGDQNFGRVDKGACLGLKAMARWIAATPMWNGGDFPNDTRLFKSEYGHDPQRWEKAKMAAKAVIDARKENGELRYKLYAKYDENDFLDLNGKVSNDKKVQRRLWEMNYDMEAIKSEWIWFVTRDKNTGWSGDVFPPSLGGHARQRPIQEQVDEYEVVIDGYGYPIYSEKAKQVYDDANPYVNRDPRFYRDIVYHGSRFSNHVINTSKGSKDEVADSYQSSSSHTGYYIRKFIKEGWTRNSGDHLIHGPAVFRLPAMIYIYAEAVNNTSGPNQEIYDMINEVRARSFMVPMPPEVKNDKELMDEYIQRERRVEFFYENDRIWRCRLYLEPNNAVELAKERGYKSAESWPYPKTQRMAHGMRPEEDVNGKIEIDGKKYKMVRFKIEDRIFMTPRHYLFPIMDDELKRTPSLVQNPGW